MLHLKGLASWLSLLFATLVGTAISVADKELKARAPVLSEVAGRGVHPPFLDEFENKGVAKWVPVDV
jgi:hypothetical protein